MYFIHFHSAHIPSAVHIPGLAKSQLTLAHFYRTQVSLGSDLWVWAYVSQSVSPRLSADLTDVTLADEDSNSITTDDVNSAI